MEFLKKRFIELLARRHVYANAPALFAEIRALHETSPRFYHTFIGHVAACIRELDHIISYTDDIDEIELALFFHDAVMDFTRADNEEQSAGLAYAFCQRIGLTETFALEVKRLILATKHNAVPETMAEKIVVDIDLSILGQIEEIFDVYETNIRREYAFVPEEVFREKRAEILEKFLARPTLYSTSYFKTRYEQPARKNLARSITTLRSK